MKIQHWALIFIIIVLPFSIVARSTINRKASLLKEETRYNNIVDNASYDATSQLLEASMIENETGVIYGKNLPLNKAVCDEVVNRFFDTLAVNFNLPVIKSQTSSAINSAKTYFAQYIPAIIIVGYDGLYVYSYEKNDSGYEFILKPKIPYAYKVPGTNLVINFTLDNYVYIISSDQSIIYQKDMPDGLGGVANTRTLKGYVGKFLDYNNDGINDFRDVAYEKDNTLLWFQDATGKYYYYGKWSGMTNSTILEDIDKSNDDPFDVDHRGGLSSTYASNTRDYVMKYTSTQTDNVSYLLYELARADSSSGIGKIANEKLRFLIDCYDYDDMKVSTKLHDELGLSNYNYNTSGYNSKDKKDIHFTEVDIDYKFDDEGNVIQEASTFHRLRRQTIINIIRNVLRQEFNEHNQFADAVGLKYDFAIPDIGRDQWNNTIDDISVLSFIQGMPLGYQTYYNNYSLGGARIVLKTNLFAETITNASDETHKIYHKSYCPCIPRDVNGKVVTSTRFNENTFDPETDFSEAYKELKLPDGKERYKATTGIEYEFISDAHAKERGYYACSECM